MLRYCLPVLVLFCSVSSAAADWTRFRGPAGNGAVESSDVPSEWSSEKNLKWKTELPGKGSSSPVMTADRIYLTCYTGYGLDMANPGDAKALVRHLLAFDRATGKELWRHSVKTEFEEDPYRGFITQHGYASSTPAADGDNVYALLGKSGLFAFDKDGNELWKRDLGQMSDPARWGDATSPVVIGNQVIVDAGILGHKFVGLDKKTGKTTWAIDDAGFTNAWATPAEVDVNGKTLALFHVPKKVMAVDPVNGKVVWTAASPLNDATCGSIITHEGVAYLMGSRAGAGMAVQCDGMGDVSDQKTVWNKSIRSSICTPVIVDGTMYWNSSGIFMAANCEDGSYVYRERLPKSGKATTFPNVDYSSPIAVGDRIILFTRNGESYVVRAGGNFDMIAHNPPFEGDDSAFSSTPAVDADELFIRSEKYLYCIAAVSPQ